MVHLSHFVSYLLIYLRFFNLFICNFFIAIRKQHFKDIDCIVQFNSSMRSLTVFMFLDGACRCL